MVDRMRENWCEKQTIHADTDSTTAAGMKKRLSLYSEKAGQEPPKEEFNQTVSVL